MTASEQAAAVLDAMYKKDDDALHEEFGCICCCAEHTFASCLARLWGGCRSGISVPFTELVAASKDDEF